MEDNINKSLPVSTDQQLSLQSPEHMLRGEKMSVILLFTTTSLLFSPSGRDVLFQAWEYMLLLSRTEASTCRTISHHMLCPSSTYGEFIYFLLIICCFCGMNAFTSFGDSIIVEDSERNSENMVTGVFLEGYREKGSTGWTRIRSRAS